MKTSYYLVTAVVLAAAVTVYAKFPPPPATPPVPQIELPPVPQIELPPVSLPPDLPLLPPVAVPPVPVAPMPKPVTPAPLPVVPPPMSIPALPVPTLPPVTTPSIPVVPQVAVPVIPPVTTPVVPPLVVVPPVATPPVVTAAPQPVVPPPELLMPVVPAPTPLPAPARVVEKPAGPGKYLVTADGKLIEGLVTKSGTGFVVRRGSLDQPHAAEKVLFVGYTKDDVYQFMLGRVDAGDPETRLKLARWCVFNGMRTQGLTEAKAVQTLQPTGTAAADMVRSLEESLKKFPEEGAAAAKPAVPPIPPAVIEPEIDMTADGVMSFTTKAHPLLVNLCATCHAKATYGGAFKLAPSTAYDTTAATTRQNLRAVAAQLKKDDPASSPLLLKALAAHGGMKDPACSSRQAAAFRNLEAWVSLAVGADVLLMRPAAVPVVAAEVRPATPGLPATGFGAEAKPDPKPTAPSPTNTGTAVDEFDPSLFNRAVHPK